MIVYLYLHDSCDDDVTPEIVGFDCAFVNGSGRVVDKKESCAVTIDGDRVTILDSGGVSTRITWTVRAVDASENAVEEECAIDVVRR